jgi:hypothetical protein
VAGTGITRKNLQHGDMQKNICCDFFGEKTDIFLTGSAL